MATATIRDLRTHFPRLKLLVAREGEVVVTDHGKPAFVLRAYRQETRGRVKRIDYFRRLKGRQPRALSAVAARGPDEADRGERWQDVCRAQRPSAPLSPPP